MLRSQLLRAVSFFIAALIVLFGLSGTGVEAGVVSTFNPATDFSGGQVSIANTPVTDGYSFTPTVNVTVDALGLWSGTPAASQLVRLYQEGQASNLASVNVASTDPISVTTANGNQYRGHLLTTPVHLTSGVTYDIVVDSLSSDFVQIHGTGVALVPNITFGSAREASGTGAFPTSDAAAVGPYFGPTFEVAAPEPSGLMLVGIGACGLLLRRGRCRN